MASSGSFRTSSYTLDGTTVGLEFAWYVKSTSIADNTKTIAWTLKGYGNKSSSYSFNSGNFKVVIDGATVYSSATRRYIGNGTLVASGETIIGHNSDGSRNFSASAEAGIYYVAVNCSGSGTFTLDTIPRQATITSAPDFNDEQNPTIKYSNLAGNTVTSLQACIANTAGTVIYAAYRDITKTASSYTFNLTDAERNALIAACTAKIMKVKFYVKTVIGGTTFYDTEEKTLTIANAEPVITSTSVADVLLESLNVTGDARKVVKGFNEMEVSMVAETRKGATIKSYKITNGLTAIGAAMGSFLNAESGEFVFSVTDSRDYTVSQKVTLPLIEYIKLSCNMNERAPDAEGNLLFTVEGNAFSGSFGYIDNEVQVYLRYAENGGEFSAWETVETVLGMDNRYTAEVVKSGLNYQSTYTFQAKAVDLLNETESPARSVKTVPTFCWNDRKIKFNAAAIFKDDILAIDEDGQQYSLKDRVNELNSKLTPQYIRVAVNNRPTISSGNKIPFNSVYNHSDCFTFDNNGTITVLESCVVRVTAVIGGQPTDSNNMRGYFWLNKNAVWQVNSIAYGSFVSCPFNTILEVSQGDTIHIHTMEGFKPSTGGVSCYCCIEKLG